MPDHIHLVMRLPETTTTPRVIQLIKGRFAKRYNDRIQSRGSLWQSPYHERVLTNENAVERAVHYVHWNPVQAKLASVPEEFPWSSARFASEALLSG
jgi:putative transposase